MMNISKDEFDKLVREYVANIQANHRDEPEYSLSYHYVDYFSGSTVSYLQRRYDFSDDEIVELRNAVRELIRQ